MNRKFEILRLSFKPRMLLFNNVQVSYVGTCPQTGISLYCSLHHNYGVKVYPDGKCRWAYMRPLHWSKNDPKHACERRYLEFPDAFGHHKAILVAHAVWMAAGRTFKPGLVIDHINGNKQDNSLANLRQIDPATNARDGGFLQKIRNKDLKPETIRRDLLLRYFYRMSLIKPLLTSWQYKQLGCVDLYHILFNGDDMLETKLQRKFNITINLMS